MQVLTRSALAVAFAVAAATSFAQTPAPATKPAAATPPPAAAPATNPQQERMRACNDKATGMKGDDRKKFMSECLKAKS